MKGRNSLKMILHKYIEGKFGLETIKNLELKVSLPSKSNDPFELLPIDKGVWNNSMAKKMLRNKNFTSKLKENLKRDHTIKNEKDFKKKLKEKEYKESILKSYSKEKILQMTVDAKNYCDKHTRIICFSSEEADETQQILMWSHYSDKHCGMKLYFDYNLLTEENDSLKKIKYETERPAIDSTLLRFFPNEIPFLNSLINALQIKSIVWSYEKEYRLYLYHDHCYFNSEKQLYFFKFNPKSLIRIDLGINCSGESEVLAEIKKKEKSHIKLFRAKINQDEFKLDFEPIQ